MLRVVHESVLVGYPTSDFYTDDMARIARLGAALQKSWVARPAADLARSRPFQKETLTLTKEPRVKSHSSMV